MTEIENVLLRQLSEQCTSNEDLARRLRDLTGQIETLKRQLERLPELSGRLDGLERFLNEQNRRIDELSALLSRYAPMLNG